MVSDLIDIEQRCLISLQDYIANLILQKEKVVSKIEKRRIQKIYEEALETQNFLQAHITTLLKTPRGRVGTVSHTPYPQ